MRHIRSPGSRVRGSQLRCLGHVVRTDGTAVGKAMLRKDLPGLRPELDLREVGEDMKVAGASDSYVKRIE